MDSFGWDSDDAEGSYEQPFSDFFDRLLENSEKHKAKQEGSTGFLGSLKQGVDGVRIQADLAQIDYTEEEIREVAEKAEHESITPLRVAKVVDHLEDGEQPEYAIAGDTTWGLRIEGGDESIRQGGIGPASVMNNLGHNILTVTDRRLVFLVPQTTGDDVHSVPFDVIHGVDTANGAPEKIIVQTTGRTYHMQVSSLGSKETIAAEIRKRSREVRQRRPASADANGDQESDPLDQIERLNDLREQGAISDEEFNEKKADLLDEI